MLDRRAHALEQLALDDVAGRDLARNPAHLKRKRNGAAVRSARTELPCDDVLSRVTHPERFAFGANWMRFAELLDESRIADAEASLRMMLGTDDLQGRSFLDIGSGSGLFSLGAARLGAGRIQSFDYDRDSVECTTAVRDQFFPGKADWLVEWGDITDTVYCSSLGTFDVVYAWGVLHHTGALWTALANTCDLVAPGGVLYLSIYNDQGRRSARWRAIKRRYNNLPGALRIPYAVLVSTPNELSTAARRLVRGRFREYVRSWKESGPRGMSRWRDLLDWAGGYPFEVAKPEDVFRFCRAQGFELRELATTGGGHGCNEFVFARTTEHEAPVRAE
jgi:2-polyprenyl-6-hydroxyphenyl methylase/3-demethylubiquinone-9 3-methyltransferase